MEEEEEEEEDSEKRVAFIALVEGPNWIRGRKGKTGGKGTIDSSGQQTPRTTAPRVLI